VATGCRGAGLSWNMHVFCRDNDVKTPVVLLYISISNNIVVHIEWLLYSDNNLNAVDELLV